ncbi:hypothetical protein ElyMa_001608000 [Elysia marginata]|uniref:Uncharacterized protein n=1 Tax=Elysia marginata TaxID=1093978 RepID=A0AAV4JIY4_9GAST|nr:hypothetical protein ElyMa_001608000 [Elysia marginata]
MQHTVRMEDSTLITWPTLKSPHGCNTKSTHGWALITQKAMRRRHRATCGKSGGSGDGDDNDGGGGGGGDDEYDDEEEEEEEEGEDAGYGLS